MENYGEKNEYYFDNSATTKVHSEIIDRMAVVMRENYGNPSSKHHKGFVAERLVEDAKEWVADTLNCNKDEILFTSGGTESNNTAIIGMALANQKRGKHIISSNIEHPAIYKALEFLEGIGFEITILKVDDDGKVIVKDLIDNIREDTILVSIMHVNNEIGSVNDIEVLSKAIKDKNSNCYFHVDAIQSYGKYIIDTKKIKVDLLSVSGHKIHGPKGVGFLYIKKGTKILPIIHGGGQQKNLRSGTENVPGIYGLGTACFMAYDTFEENLEQIVEVKNLFCEGLNKLNDKYGGIRINSKYSLESAPHIVSASFAGIKSEVMLHALEEKGIYVSSGSACSSNHPSISGTLKAVHLPANLLDSTIRFSFSVYNYREDIEYCLNVLDSIIPTLRKIVRK